MFRFGSPENVLFGCSTRSNKAVSYFMVYVLSIERTSRELHSDIKILDFIHSIEKSLAFKKKARFSSLPHGRSVNELALFRNKKHGSKPARPRGS